MDLTFIPAAHLPVEYCAHGNVLLKWKDATGLEPTMMATTLLTNAQAFYYLGVVTVDCHLIQCLNCEETLWQP